MDRAACLLAMGAKIGKSAAERPPNPPASSRPQPNLDQGSGAAFIVGLLLFHQPAHLAKPNRPTRQP